MYELEALKKDVEKCDLNIKMFEDILKRETELHFSTDDKKVFDKSGDNMKIFGAAIINAHKEKEELAILIEEAEK